MSKSVTKSTKIQLFACTPKSEHLTVRVIRTGSSLSPASHIDASGDNEIVLPPCRQPAVQRHFEEVERRVLTMLVELQLRAQLTDFSTSISER